MSRSTSSGGHNPSKEIALESDQILGLLRRSDVGLGLLSSNPPPSALDGPLRREEDYVAGHLSSGYHFWSNVVLENHRKRETLLGWLQGGVSVSEFVEPTAAGVHEGHRYSGAELTAIELPNRVALEHQAWVDAEVKSLVERGIIARWEDVADIAASPRPVMSLPLTVDETEGPRLVWDGRWLNLMCRQPKIRAGGVTDVAQLSWPGAHQVTIALERGMEHVPLNPDSWKFFGLKWKGVFYIWTVLCSGWCSSAYVHHTLSEAVVLYLRSKDIPVLACMDELWVATLASERQHTPEKQAVGAGVAAYLALAVLYHCGYFVARAKSHLVPTTRVLFLGVTCDTARCRFEVPEDRLAEMEESLTRATSGGAVER